MLYRNFNRDMDFIRQCRKTKGVVYIVCKNKIIKDYLRHFVSNTFPYSQIIPITLLEFKKNQESDKRMKTKKIIFYDETVKQKN